MDKSIADWINSFQRLIDFEMTIVERHRETRPDVAARALAAVQRYQERFAAEVSAV